MVIGAASRTGEADRVVGEKPAVTAQNLYGHGGL